METKSPTEYITLSAGPNDNYATIYGYRLAQPYSCPVGTTAQECRYCVSNSYQKAGETVFRRIRLNVANMTVARELIKIISSPPLARQSIDRLCSGRNPGRNKLPSLSHQ